MPSVIFSFMAQFFSVVFGARKQSPALPGIFFWAVSRAISLHVSKSRGYRVEGRNDLYPNSHDYRHPPCLSVEGRAGVERNSVHQIGSVCTLSILFGAVLPEIKVGYFSRAKRKNLFFAPQRGGGGPGRRGKDGAQPPQPPSRVRVQNNLYAHTRYSSGASRRLRVSRVSSLVTMYSTTTTKVAPIQCLTQLPQKLATTPWTMIAFYPMLHLPTLSLPTPVKKRASVHKMLPKTMSSWKTSLTTMMKSSRAREYPERLQTVPRYKVHRKLT